MNCRVQTPICLLVLFLASCSSSDIGTFEGLRTTHRRAQEIDGEVQNSCQILAYCAAKNESEPVRVKAANGLCIVLGAPDPTEIIYSMQLTEATVTDVVEHGVALVKKRNELNQRYEQQSIQVSKDFLTLSLAAGKWTATKWLLGVFLLAGTVIGVRKLL